MTLSSVIPGAPAQATPRNRPSQDAGDKSKDFYHCLLSSTQDDGGTPNSSVGERTAKAEKQANKKTDTDQATNTIVALVPPQTEQPTPPLPIAALLGLPTVQKTDVAETGKTNDDGKAVLSLANTGSGIGSDQQPAVNTGTTSLLSVSLTSTQIEPKTDKPQSPRKDQNDNAHAGLDPALLNGIVPQQPLDTAPVKENSGVDSGNSTNAMIESKANGSNAELLTAGASPSGTPTGPAPGNLAFALRLNEGPLDSKSEQHTAQVSPAGPTGIATQIGGADLTTSVQAAVGSQLKEQSHQHDNGSGTAFYEVPQAQPQNTLDTSQVSSEQSVSTAAADLQAKQDTANSEPVRNVHMQIVGDNSRVDVRLMDRGGELHVSVKSGDINLAQNLQDHMQDLTSRLEQQRFQTEVWVPKLADNAKAEMSGTRDFSSNGNNNSNHSGNSDRQGKGQQQYKPDWVDVLENSTRGTGKIDQTWLQ